MNLLNYAFSFGVSLIVVAASSTSISTDDLSSSTSTTATTSTSTYVSSTLSISSIALPSSVAPLPTQIYQINQQRPKMINQINQQRSGLNQPLVCQDSMLTSIAQQHANDMAALDDLDHNLPCNSDAYPIQFCQSSVRLSPFGEAGENIVALAGNDGSAMMAMGQVNADSGQFSTMMNPDYLYVGVGMAMNPVSGKYYWVQVFSAGNFQGVSCTLSPTVSVLNAMNQTTTTVQPTTGLNLSIYPRGITNGKSGNSNNQKLFCTLVPFAQGTGTSVLPLGQLPYPTITLVPQNSSSIVAAQASGVMAAFNSAISAAGATIVGPSSIPMIVMQVSPTTTTSTIETTTTSDTSSMTMTMSLDPSSFNVASMFSTFVPTNSAQSAFMSQFSTMMTDPSMSSAAVQMAQFLQMASATSIITSTSISS